MSTPYAFDLRCEGASHKKQKKGCQDYSFHVQEDSHSAAIVCDGHGGSDYVRSATGAQFAANVANELIQSFVKSVDVSRLKNAEEREPLLTKLKARIIEGWKRKVKEYHAEHPFTEAETARLSEKARKRYFDGGRVEVAYGTTLLAAVCAKDYWFGLHIGDGRCVYADNRNGFQEIPLDERCFLNATTSICDTDALAHFHHVFSEELPAAVFVACDGVDGSFGSPEKLYNFYKTILYSFATEDPEKAKEGLQDFLPRLSATGSGDDVSVAAVLDLDAVKNLDMIRAYDPGKAKAQKEENLRREAERNEREREYLSKTADLKNEIRSLQTQFDAKARELADVSDDVTEVTRKINRLTAQKAQDEQEYNDGQRKLNKLQQRLLEMRDALNRNQSQMKEVEYRKTKLDVRQSGLKRDFDKLKAELDGKKKALEQLEKDGLRRPDDGDENPRKTSDVDVFSERQAELDREKERLAQERAKVEQARAAVAEEKAAIAEEKAAIAGKATELARKEEEMAAQNSPIVYYVPPYPPYGPYPNYAPPLQTPDAAPAQSSPAVQPPQTPPVAQQSPPTITYEQALNLLNLKRSIESHLQFHAEKNKRYAEEAETERKRFEDCLQKATEEQTDKREQDKWLAAAKQAQDKMNLAQQNAQAEENSKREFDLKLTTIQEQLRLYEQQAQTQGAP